MSSNKLLEIDIEKLINTRNYISSEMMTIESQIKLLKEKTSMIDNYWAGEAKDTFIKDINNDINQLEIAYKSIKIMSEKYEFAVEKYALLVDSIDKIIEAI